jgi:Predicted AAA-ATPase
MQYATKVDKMDNVAPQIHTGGDFGKLVKESSIFVDKSLFIKDIIENKSEVILITMPRRWGKSLNLDMLKRFLSVEIDKEGNIILNNQTENYKLFAGGTIEVQDGFYKREKEILTSELVVHNPKALDLHGQYPVIFIDFKDCKRNNFEN